MKKLLKKIMPTSLRSRSSLAIIVTAAVLVEVTSAVQYFFAKEGIRQEAQDLLDQVGLAQRMDNYPWQLSGGQQQRVAIARALALKPEILCFDEPTSALDPELTGEVLRVIQSLKSSDLTMVIVTHEMAFARDVSDHVIFMDGGVIVEQGSPDDIINNPTQERTIQFLARFN